VLLCNQQGLKIYSKLYLDLQALRLSGSTTFWVEAICIDQEDPGELSCHIELLEHIYRQATRLVLANPGVWKAGECQDY
jgi:hypothetical protein